MISQSQISKLANRLQQENGGRRIPDSVLERDYCIAWFLAGLSKNPLKDKLAFKGGTALRRCHFADYRFSEDLDFTLLQTMSFDEIKRDLEDIYRTTKTDSNISFQFSRPDTNMHKNSHTFYLSFEGPLPKQSSAREIKVDITISEKIFYELKTLPVLKTYDEFSDLQNDIRITGYSLLEVASEKTVALLDRARTEPRDLYDLWYLTEDSCAVDLSNCMDGINAKLIHRQKTLESVKNEFAKKEAKFESTWKKRLGTQMNSLPEFEKVFRGVKRRLRQTGLI